MTLPDYQNARLSRLQLIGSICAGAAVVFTGAYLFYHSVIISLLLSAIGWFTPRYVRRWLVDWRRDRLKRQFKEALQSIASSLAAGRSVENALCSVPEDLKMVYPDGRTEIIREFHFMASSLRNGETPEKCLRAFADRARIDDITQFADVLATAKRSGGDMIGIVRRTAQMIGDKMEVEQEISVLIARKRFESRVMLAVPFVFMAFLSLTAPDYMAPLYSGIGYLLLTGALAALYGCYLLTRKWMTIEV
ncbi:type II secretion system F family protein [Paenibacillus tarimensis]|uniref:type II secretion system F family protein n=1 Tax=Paenibacillus tarimensis TaxID=416012 RepID=UPI001F1E5D4B|nr:type II secretion system F family protein [Paenibacillus tarimensis]MCF2943540.1 type II secretion system F family protein [Paenibacillus tarimensis]